jgi:hypothetical protein
MTLNDARAYVDEHAEVQRPYGGGLRMIVTAPSGEKLDALDGWNGEPAARETLAQKLHAIA